MNGPKITVFLGLRVEKRCIWQVVLDSRKNILNSDSLLERFSDEL
jgi:hypothetical protein